MLDDGDGLKDRDLLIMMATRGARGEAAWWDWAEAAAIRALGLAHAGELEDAQDSITRALRMEPERSDIAYYAAGTYAVLGNAESALKWLRTSVERGHQELWWGRVDPDLDSLREDPRFTEVMDHWDARLRALR